MRLLSQRIWQDVELIFYLEMESLILQQLYVIGCGKHEARRIDDQLRGRAGRQGDPGKACSSFP